MATTAAAPFADPLALPPVPPPAPAAHSWRDGIVVVAFVAALVAALVGTIVDRNLAVTAFENRTTAPWPRLPTSLSAVRTFPRAFEAALADRFGGRDAMIRWHHETMISLFGVSPSAKVMLGRDGWLFFLGEDTHSLDRDYRGVYPYPPEQPAEIASELKRRHDFLAALGIPYIVMIVPDKYTVYAEYLPTWVTRGRGGTRLDRLMTALRAYPDITVLDLRGPLRHAKVDERVYFKTDSHWNLLGGIAGYDALIAAVRAKVPATPAVPARRPPYVPGETYSGDLARLLGVEETWTEEDLASLWKVEQDTSRCAKPLPASVPPPAPQGTISVIGRSGYAACAATAMTSAPAARIRTRARENGAMIPPVERDWSGAGDDSPSACVGDPI